MLKLPPLAFQEGYACRSGPSVLQTVDDPKKWFLIDREDASMLPTYAAEHLRGGVHSPRVYADGHGAEVDIWAVGNLFLMPARLRPPCLLL